MTAQLLDPDTFEWRREFHGVDLVEVLDAYLSEAVRRSWVSAGLMRPHNTLETDSDFGLALANPALGWDGRNEYDAYWNDPTQMGWLLYGNNVPCALNGARKNRAAARTGYDTLYLVDTMGDSVFRDTVESVEEDGTMRWGDFPHPGSTFINVGPHRLLVAVSRFRGDEDDTAARASGGALGTAMRRGYRGERVFRFDD